MKTQLYTESNRALALRDYRRSYLAALASFDRDAASRAQAELRRRLRSV